jgi:hypothetical protein
MRDKDILFFLLAKKKNQIIKKIIIFMKIGIHFEAQKDTKLFFIISCFIAN